MSIREVLPLSFLILIFGTLSPLSAKLSKSNSEELTRHLEILSGDWVKESVGAANKIVLNPKYDKRDWYDFFSGYFQDHPFNWDVRKYLGYPVFGWGPDEVHVELQEGLARALEEKLGGHLEEHRNRLGEALRRDEALGDSIWEISRFMIEFSRSRETSERSKERIQNSLLGWISASEELQLHTTVDVEKHPSLAGLKGQLAITALSFSLRDIIEISGKWRFMDPKELTPDERKALGQELGLRGKRFEIWVRHGVIIIDNNSLNTTQLEAVSTLLDTVPTELHHTGLMTVRTSLGEFRGVAFRGFHSATGGCNIWGQEIGEKKGNGFPDDVPAHYADQFWLGLVHEFNHIVDQYYVKHDDPYRKALIARAGRDQKNYLRSTSPEGAFVKAPQEFFASISNQYFANTELTLHLGISRLDQGRSEPLRQFLFFAETYSLGGEDTLSFKIDEDGIFSSQRIPISRNQWGHIDSMRFGKTTYHFERDMNRGVIAYRKTEGS